MSSANTKKNPDKQTVLVPIDYHHMDKKKKKHFSNIICIYSTEKKSCSLLIYICAHIYEEFRCKSL